MATSAFGTFILDYVRTHNITINKFAQQIGTSHTTLDRWIDGKTEPTLKQLSKLAIATSTDLCYLVELIYPPPERSVSPEITRLAESIGKLPIEAKEMIDSIILGLSMKSDKKNSNIR